MHPSGKSLIDSFHPVHIIVVLKAGAQLLVFMEDCGPQGHVVSVHPPADARLFWSSFFPL